jgi:hypothetical protein
MRFLPRFSLQTVFVLLSVAAIPMAWVAYQLNWIRQRHAFDIQFNLDSKYLHTGYGPVNPLKAPRPLALFGERPVRVLYVHHEHSEQARDLFPESAIVETTFDASSAKKGK